jgi:hypothetical protein
LAVNVNPHSAIGLPSLLSIQLVINTRDLLDPGAPLMVFQLQYFLAGPVKLIGYIGYLLPELVERVAYYSPDGTSSTSNSWLQLGHCVGIVTCSASFMRLYRSCK